MRERGELPWSRRAKSLKLSDYECALIWQMGVSFRRSIEQTEATLETLRTILEQAETGGVAIGHFNVSDLVTLKAIFGGARDLSVPVIVGASRENDCSLAFAKSLRW